MRLRVAELLDERGISAYELAKRAGGRISLSAAYRLARGEWKCISADTLAALCDVFEIDDPGPLFERELNSKPARPVKPKRSHHV